MVTVTVSKDMTCLLCATRSIDFFLHIYYSRQILFAHFHFVVIFYWNRSVNNMLLYRSYINNFKNDCLAT